jgi:DNA-binding CsgD family transcriptional regulator
MGGDYAAVIAALTRAIVATYAGEDEQARTHLAKASDAAARCGSQWLADQVTAAQGFLEVSQGNYNAALQTLEPLRSRLLQAPEQTEITTAAYVSDLVESMLAVGQVDGAEELVAAMESAGRRTQRAWTSAIGARCRGLLCAARGDLDSALSAVQRAMNHHQQLGMPFETARTQLLLGEIQRRHRSKGDSGENLRAAIAAFESMGAPLWAQRARTSLARGDLLRPQSGDGLTPSERRVAELVATGMTNRAIASALFISPKTVEANVARIYRKLEIPSRAALARYVGDTPA